MIKFFKESDEVLYTNEDFVCITNKDLFELKQLSDQNIRQRVRFCAHKDPGNLLHEMLIVHTKECYVRPHFHIDKPESLHVVEGQADLIIFDKSGKITNVLNLSNVFNKGFFYYRIKENTIHMLIIKSDYFIFHESTKGPFKRENTKFPSWAPKGDLISDNSFIRNLKY